MHAKYLRKINFFSAKKNSRSSMAWKGILNSKDLLSTGMRWIVGNESQINFWLFNWAYLFPLFNFLNDQAKS